MAYDFVNRVSKQDINNVLIQSLGAHLKDEDLYRLRQYRNAWNFYEGYHWEDISNNDKPQVTVNYCRAFVDKFVSFEMGKGFNVKMKPEIETIEGGNDPLDFINETWEQNKKLERLVEIGQSKSVTGDAWVQVAFEPKFLKGGKKNPNFIDPFDEYTAGRVRIVVIPSAIVFPVYSDEHDKDNFTSLNIMYPITQKKQGFFMTREKQVLYRQEWTNDAVNIYEGDMNVPVTTIPNKYGCIPFKQIKNHPLQGKNFGQGDLDDVIPINMEINLKKSDISEIIDYHSAPITIVFGARIGQLERGANKVWGGLPKDARIENLRLDGDLTAAQNYVHDLKTAMHEVGKIPEGALGSSMAISNTSGVALQTVLMPLIERNTIKQSITKEGLQWINKMILLVGEKEGLISVPDGVNRKDFFYNEVSFDSSLPKDGLLELQQIELEMKLGLEERGDAMKRLGKGDIQNKMKKIDEDAKANPSFYGQVDVEKQLELAQGQAEIQKRYGVQQQAGVNSATTPNKPVGKNKDGGDKKVNAGFTNSPKPQK